MTTPSKKADRLAVVVLLAAQLAFAAFTVTYGRFIGHDEIGWKAAGRSWGQTGRFVATDLEGVGYWPREWLCRPPAPPLYALTFGAYVRLAGLTFRTNVVFDLLLHLLLSWICFLVARTLDRDGPVWPAALAAIFALPLGNPGRPEGLGMLFAYSAWIITRRSESTRHWFGAGVLSGVAAVASPAAAFFIGVLGLLRKTRLRNIAAWGFASALVFFSSMALFSWRLAPNTSSGMTSLASAATSRSWSHIADGFQYGRFAGPLVIATLIPVLIAGWRYRSLWLAPVVVQLAIPLLLPREFYYMWITGPVMLAICMILFQRASARMRALIVMTALPVYLYAISRTVLLAAAIAAIPEDQTIEANQPLVENIIPKSSTVMTYDYWPALSSRYRVYSTEANPRWDLVDYIVLTGNGSGTPGKRQTLLADQEPHLAEYEVVLDRLNRKPFHIGPIHTNSAYGFGPLILKRIRRPGESNESAHVRTACR